MEITVLHVFLGLAVAAAIGFLVAWLIRAQALRKSAVYAYSLEQLLAGTMRDRDSAAERERARFSESHHAQQSLGARLAELQQELEHREIQVVTFRDEAIQLAQIREELGQRLAKREQAIQDLERRLGARTRELEQAQGGGLIRQPGTRATGPERELAALMVAHENDMADLEARYLGIVRERDVALEEAAQRIRELEFALASGAAAQGYVTSPEQREELEELARKATEAHARVERLQQQLREESEIKARLQLRVTQLEALQAHVSHTNGSRGDADAAEASDEEESGENEAAEAESKRRRTRRKRRREADDLKEISGVDASVEQGLHLLGVTSFRQVARWKEKDVDRIAQKLYQPAERIRNEGWVESAREAHTRKYGKAP